MKRITYLLLFVCLASCFSACKKDVGLEGFDIPGQFKKDTTAIRAFGLANNIPLVKDLNNNFFYQIIEPGSGEEVNALSTVSIIYKGRLLDGTVFDNKPTAGAPFSLSGLIITGWKFGIPLIKKGGKIRLLLPSLHGFGNQANGPVPANSVLDFDVELVDVK